MVSGLGFDGTESELEVQPAEFGFRLGGVGLEDLGQVLKLLLDPRAKVGEFRSVGFILGPFELFLQPLDRRLTLGNGLQQ